VFQLKDVENIASKEKGVVSQAVKDILKSLVDDELVDSDKIGTSTYYWVFPSKALAERDARLANLRKRVTEAGEEYRQIQDDIAKKQKELESSKGVSPEMLATLAISKRSGQILTKELLCLKEKDPSASERLEDEVDRMRDTANRWTDNIFALRSWIRQRFKMSAADIERAFEIQSDLDYIH
ncbi:meiotic nuclear division protein 1-like, partial [Tropilaelaps mercedesae]